MYQNASLVNYIEETIIMPMVESTSLTIAETLFLTSTSAFLAEIFTYPMDLLKTRQQAYKLLHRPKNAKNIYHLPLMWSNLIHLAEKIIRKEGVLKLWDGLGPALLRQIGATGMRTTIYEKLRDEIFGKEKNKMFPFRYAIFSSWSAGALSQVVVSPTDLIKVLLQTEGHRRVLGQKPRVTSSWQALQLIVKKRGISGLWRGWMVNMHVAGLTSVAGLTTYDKCKQICSINFNFPDNYKIHIFSSIVTSYVTTLVITPADTIKTRIMNQDPQPTGLPQYKSGIDCIMQMIKFEGFWSLYAGFWPQFMRLFPWYLLFWVSYEHERQIFGKDTF